VLDEGFKVIDQLRLDRIRTKDFVDLLDRFELGKTLVVLPEPDEIIEKSARNIPNVKVLRSEGLNVYDLLNYHAVILSRECVSRIEEALA
jgi:large subunit ribosomal protein L4